MKLLKARVRWWEGYANDPTLEILVDKMPDMKDIRYRRNGPMFYGELDGYVSFYYYARPGEGFGGRHYTLTMEDGEEVLLKGPFSSNAASMNEAGFGPCLDVAIIDKPDSYERGFTFFSGHVTLDLIEQSKHIVEIGSGYHRKCGTGCTQDQEEYIEFPEGSSFTFFTQCDGCYSPGVLLPSGEVWVKNVRAEQKWRCRDLSAEQSQF